MALLAQLVPDWVGGRAQLVPSWVEPNPLTPAFDSPADRGTLDIPNCSYAGGTFVFRNRWDQTSGTSGARFMYARVTGVLGLTPLFQMLIDNLDGVTNPASQFAFSYDNVTWERFSNRGTQATYFSFSHNSPFASNTVYIAIWPAWTTGRTAQWIQGLLGTGYISDTTSSSGYVFETRTATVNELGAAITATPLHAFKISIPGNAPDGSPKRNMVLMAGVHSSEDVGNFCLKGAVEFLVTDDPQAALVRSWFNILVYPLVASAGRKGGSTRGDFQSGYMTADVNREWDTSVFETLVKHKAAIVADTGGEAVVFMDFHGTTAQAYRYDYFDPTTDYTTWATAIQSVIPGLVQTQLDTVGTSVQWAVAALSPSIAIIHENPYIRGSNVLQSFVESSGADHMRAVALLASQGYFGDNLAIEGEMNAIDDGNSDICVMTGTIEFTVAGVMAATEDPTPDICVMVGQSVSYVAPPEIHWRDSLLTQQISAPSIIAKKAYVGDIGTAIILDTGQDISLAITTTIEVRKPNGTFVSWPSVPNGTNSVRFDTQADSLDMPGPWKFQAKVTLPSGTVRGETTTLVVYPAFG